jgi:HTH-type transcriptional regulator, transcriptional repressor of NAD biosynthesis genes
MEKGHARTDSNMKFRTAVVIGKFYPPHHGHHFLIETALVRSELVSVIVCERPSDMIPGALRRDWLQEVHPHANVILIDDRYDENDSRIWAENTIHWLGYSPDAVFTSEDYGDRYAAFMNSVHVQVDRERIHVPCSGTMLREDPFFHWDFITPPVRSWFAKRVCILGAESTGTTTLATMLAETLNTNWVPEYGREYSAIKQSRGENEWNLAEFIHIAEEQTRRENLAAREANRVVILDTNAFATTLWHRRYRGYDAIELERIAANGKCDLYLLTGDEIPFVQDGLRDGEAIRHTMHEWFVSALTNQTVPWKLLRGSEEERLSVALDAINNLFRDSKWKPYEQLS